MGKNVFELRVSRYYCAGMFLIPSFLLIGGLYTLRESVGAWFLIILGVVLALLFLNSFKDITLTGKELVVKYNKNEEASSSVQFEIVESSAEPEQQSSQNMIGQATGILNSPTRILILIGIFILGALLCVFIYSKYGVKKRGEYS